MSPQKLAPPHTSDGTRIPYASSRRDFENSATAAHEAICAARFGHKRANAN